MYPITVVPIGVFPVSELILDAHGINCLSTNSYDRGKQTRQINMQQILSTIMDRRRKYGGQVPWPLLNFKTLHRNSIFTIENHLSLAKWPP